MSTWLQVYGTDGANDYRANCKTPREAAILVGALGPGATIRNGKTVVWREGTDMPTAAPNCDTSHIEAVAAKCQERTS